MTDSRLFYKRIFDLVVSGIAILIFLPVYIIVGMVIKVDSKGPIIYKGKRIGKNGVPFMMYKFRSMIPDAEMVGSTATAHMDPRITRIGTFIRKYKIDELPQLFNVFIGDMSIVGPRPEVEEHTKCYRGDELIILTVLPGITDYSSIRFRNLNEMLGSEDPNKVFIEKYRGEKNKLRIEYVLNQSFSEDLLIILKTIKSVLFH